MAALSRLRKKAEPALPPTRSQAEVRGHAAALARLVKARDHIARLCDSYPEALHIFERLDAEVRTAEALLADDPVARARARLAQKEIGLKSA